MIRPPELRLEWLRSFLGVVETGGFCRAALALRSSQPTVSTHVKDLETLLGAELLEKAGGRMKPTAPGEAVAATAREILDDVRRLKDSAAQSDVRVAGPLSIGASTTPGNYLLPSLVGRFERAHPEVRTRLWVGNSAQVLRGLLRNEFDLAAVGVVPSDAGLVIAPLGEDDIVVFAGAGHPLARLRGRIAPSECARHRFLLREEDSATRGASRSWFEKHRIHPPVMELGCPETLKRMVAAGLGIGVLSKHALEVGAGKSEFRVLHVPGFPIRRRLHLCRLKRKRLTRTVTAFLELAEADR